MSCQFARMKQQGLPRAFFCAHALQKRPRHPLGEKSQIARGVFGWCRVRKSKPVEKLLTIAQLSELIQISRSTLYEWTHTGFIPHYKLPKGVRFKEAEIDNWIKNRHKKGRSSYKLEI